MCFFCALGKRDVQSGADRSDKHGSSEGCHGLLHTVLCFWACGAVKKLMFCVHSVWNKRSVSICWVGSVDSEKQGPLTLPKDAEVSALPVKFTLVHLLFPRTLASSSNRPREDSWLKSLFVRKVDPRKDAHSNLLAKKETSSLYKLQCE